MTKNIPYLCGILAFRNRLKIFTKKGERIMFTPITLTGRVTADLELQTSQNRTEYVQFNVAVNKGYGEQEHANFYQCVLFGKAAERIVNAGARKGSLLFITGDLDLVEFIRKDGTKGLIPKITVYEWSYVPGGKRTESSNANAGSGAPAGTDNGVMNVEDCGENGLPFN